MLLIFFMRIGIYPGSFDPLTNGHLDVIERSKDLYDKLIVAIAHNRAKKTLFTQEERINILNYCCKNYTNVDVDAFDGLLVEYCRKKQSRYIVRGLRSTSDFEYEYTIATANKKLAPEIETVFLMTKSDNFFISSNIVKEIASFKGSVSSFVPQFVEEQLIKKFSS